MKLRQCLVGMLSAGAVSLAAANPEGATVVHGNAQFANPDAATLEVTNSNNAIINWQSFSIDGGETTRFVQPSADSAVLNRVTGADPSAIHGQLNSNGRVFLINQNGILVGNSGVINTAGFVGSTLDISDADFLDNQLDFAGDAAGGIVNRGFITAGAGGEIVLVAPDIENHGAIHAENGRILLAAGEKVTLGSAGLDGIEFEVQAPDNRALNLGELIAERGSVGVFAGSIQNDGAIEANSIGTDAAGNIVLEARSDIEVGAGATLQANGGDGGEITVQSETGTSWVSGDMEAVGGEGEGGRIRLLGERVALMDNAGLDASGRYGGGEVLVGGDYRGLNPAVQNARGTFAGADTSIKADAMENGDGGRVIVWADEATRAYGRISATGGALRGNGGFVETSGKQYLDTGLYAPDVSAAHGNAGEWLLDPYNIEIVADNGTLDGLTPVFTADLDVSTISAGAIETVLNGDGTVTIDTNALEGSQRGDVTFNSAVSKSLGNGVGTLQVNADGDILINEGITASAGTLDIDFLADRNGDGDGGFIDLDTTAVITNGGFISLRAPRGVTVDPDSSVDSGGGQIDFISDNGDIVLQEATNSPFVSSGAGPINFLARNGIIDIQGDSGVVSGGAGGVITLDAMDILLGATGGTNVNADTESVNLIFGQSVGLGGATGAAQLDDDELTAVTADTLSIETRSGGLQVDAFPSGLNFTNLQLTSAADIEFVQAGVDAIVLDGGAVELNADGGAIINDSAGDTDVFSDTLNATAADGIDLETVVLGLAYENTTGGDVNILNQGLDPLTLSSAINSGDGNITVHHEFSGTATAADLTINGEVTQGEGRLTFEVSDVSGNASSGDIINNANITLSGGGTFRTLAGSTFRNTSAIQANNDIVIAADNLDLTADSSIDAGPDATTVLRRSTTGTWGLGGVDGVLTSDELNTIQNNIAIGDDSGSIATAGIIGEIGFSGGQNISIQTASGIEFADSADTLGISGAGTVELVTGGSITHNSAGNTDISADRLMIDAPGGVGLSGTPLTTQVGVFDVVSENGVFISNDGGARIDRIRTTAAPVNFQNTGGDIVLEGGRISAEGGSVDLTGDGNIRLLGGDTAESGARIAGSSVTINADGNLELLGGEATDARVGISSVNNFAANIGGDLTLRGGSGQGAEAVIGEEDGASEPLQMRFDVGGDFSLTGGSGQDAAAGIGATGRSVDILIGFDTDGQPAPVGGDITITAGSGGAGDEGLGAIAGIGTFGAGNDANITIRGNGSLAMASDAAGGNNAFLGANDAGGAIDIQVGMSGSDTGGNLDIGTGHMTTDGSVALQAGGDILLDGGTLDVGDAGTSSIESRLNITGGTARFAGPVAFNAPVDLDNGGVLTLAGTTMLNGQINNAGRVNWTGGDIDGEGGVNNLDDGLFMIENNRTFNPVFSNRGRVVKASDGTTRFAAGFNQQAGSLAGIGTIAAPVVDIAGGAIAPGTHRGPLAGDGVVGTLNIDGDFVLGAGGTLSLDLMGADDETGSQAGVLYDQFNVGGHAQLGGGLELVVNTRRYIGAAGDRYRPFAFDSRDGRFESLTGQPSGYAFARRVSDDGRLSVYMARTPFGASRGGFVTEDEIQWLTRDMSRQLEELIRVRRKPAFMGEPGDEAERDKRRAMVCS